MRFRISCYYILGILMTFLSILGVLWINDFLMVVMDTTVNADYEKGQYKTGFLAARFFMKDPVKNSNETASLTSMEANDNKNDDEKKDGDEEVLLDADEDFRDGVDTSAVQENIRSSIYNSPVGTRDIDSVEDGTDNNNGEGEKTLYLFHANSTEFIDEFEKCIRDRTCQVFYHHVQKTSGTYVGSVLFPWMNKRFENPMKKEAMQRLQNRVVPKQSVQIENLLRNRENDRRKHPQTPIGRQPATLVSKNGVIGPRQGAPSKNQQRHLVSGNEIFLLDDTSGNEFGDNAESDERISMYATNDESYEIPFDSNSMTSMQLNRVRKGARPTVGHSRKLMPPKNPSTSVALPSQNAAPKNGGPQQHLSINMQMLPPHWCCYNRVMERLRLDPMNYCRYKFSTWEVSASEMNRALDSCFYDQPWNRQNETNNENHDKSTNSGIGKVFSVFGGGNKPLDADDAKEKNVTTAVELPFTRAIVLINYREPLSRALSLIHHLCNNADHQLHNEIIRGNWDSLNFTKHAAGEVVDACHRCSYHGKRGDPYQSTRPLDEIVKFKNGGKIIPQGKTGPQNVSPMLKKLEAARQQQPNVGNGHNPRKQEQDYIYKTDSEIFDHFVVDTVNKLKGVKVVANHIWEKNRRTGPQPKTNVKGGKHAKTFLLDTADTTKFLDQLQRRFPSQPLPEGRPNKHHLYKSCRFDTSKAPEMIEGLKPGKILYENLTAGFI